MTRRLVGSYLLISAFLLVVLGVPLGIFFQQQQIDALTTDIERDATVLATLYEDTLETEVEPDPGPARNYATDTGARVVIVDEVGISLLDTEAAVDRDLSTRPEIGSALEGLHATGRRHSDTLGTDLVYAAVPIASSGNVHGAVRVTLDTQEVREVTRRFWLGLGAATVVALLTVTAVGWVIATSISRPVRRLQAEADRFAAGDLSTDTEPSERLPELRSLETSMIAMAHQLHDIIERQRRFVADASHQLRTPLTALRLRLENLQGAPSDDPAPDGGELQEELERAIDETERLGQLIADLLRLATASREVALEAQDLRAIVQDRIDTWSAVAAESGVTLRAITGSAPVRAMAAPGAVEQVLDNLLENAIRAAPLDSTITVVLDTAGDVARVAVADQGEGLTDQAKQRAVERFWRGDSSSEGTGLGLAIVTQLVENAGGTVTLSDASPQGLVVTFTLPLAGRRA